MSAAKRAFAGCFAVVALGATLRSAALAQEPRSYPMLCKGGGDFTVQVRSDDSYDGTQIAYTFSKGTQAATSGLNAGECAWMDRGVRGNEPTGMLFEFPGLILYTNLRQTNGVMQAIFQPSGNSVRNFDRLRSAIWGGQEFQVYVYNDGTETLKVTRFGP